MPFQVMMNFTYVLKQPQQFSIGSSNASDTWERALIDGLKRKEFDVAVSPMVFSTEENSEVSYSYQLGEVHHRLFIKNLVDSFNLGSYTNGITTLVWGCIGLFCVVCPPFIYLTTQ